MMIIRNINIGEDAYGHKLQCGDICIFKINLQRAKCEEKVEEMKGMIIYDEDTYSFAFETLDSYAPVLLMSCVESKSIKKLFESNSSNFCDIPDGDKWKEIFNSNVMIR